MAGQAPLLAQMPLYKYISGLTRLPRRCEGLQALRVGTACAPQVVVLDKLDYCSSLKNLQSIKDKSKLQGARVTGSSVSARSAFEACAHTRRALAPVQPATDRAMAWRAVCEGRHAERGPDELCAEGGWASTPVMHFAAQARPLACRLQDPVRTPLSCARPVPRRCRMLLLHTGAAHSTTHIFGMAHSGAKGTARRLQLRNGKASTTRPCSLLRGGAARRRTWTTPLATAWRSP